MKKLNKIIFGLILIFFYCIFFKYDFPKINNKSIYIKDFTCDCQKNITIKVKKINDKYDINLGFKRYTLNSDALPTCNLGKSLKRGPNQKIISYSLYGKNPRYYNLLDNLIVKAKEFYPSYVLRIYHDDSINISIICQIECSNSHIEFCDVQKLPQSLTETEKFINLQYIHLMIWRFLPIGDNLADLIMSRDLDSLLLKREFDSVKEWLKSDNIGHIMRGKFYFFFDNVCEC